MCRRIAAWVRRKDRLNHFITCPYQQAPSPPMTPELYVACEKAVHIVTPDGRVIRAGRASLFILERIGWDRVARILSLPPFVWFVEVAYRIVADHRPFFSRFLFTREYVDDEASAARSC